MTDDSKRTTDDDAKLWQKLTLPLARWAKNGKVQNWTWQLFSMAAYWMADWNQMSNLSEEPSINNSDSWRRVREVSTLQKTPPFSASNKQHIGLFFHHYKNISASHCSFYFLNSPRNKILKTNIQYTKRFIKF